MMSKLFRVLVFGVFVVMCLCLASAKKRPDAYPETPDFLHKAPPNYDLYHDTLKRTGIWRSKWFMYRQFYKNIDGKDDEIGHSDRLCIRFLPNQSLRAYSKSKRPLLVIGKKVFNGFGYGDEIDVDVLRDAEAIKETPKKSTYHLKKSRKWQSRVDRIKEKHKVKQKIQERLFNTDGRYLTEIDPNNAHRMHIEVFEVDEQSGDEYTTRHEISWDYGMTDPLSNHFSIGRVLRLPSSEDKVQRYLPYLVGFTSVSANAHRPVVSKEFQAFQ